MAVRLQKRRLRRQDTTFRKGEGVPKIFGTPSKVSQGFELATTTADYAEHQGKPSSDHCYRGRLRYCSDVINLKESGIEYISRSICTTGTKGERVECETAPIRRGISVAVRDTARIADTSASHSARDIQSDRKSVV